MYRCRVCGGEFAEAVEVSPRSPMWPDVTEVCPECGADAEDAEIGDECPNCGGFVSPTSSASVCDACMEQKMEPKLVRLFLEAKRKEAEVSLNPLVVAAFDLMDIEQILMDKLHEMFDCGDIPNEELNKIMRTALDGAEDEYLRWLARRRPTMDKHGRGLWR